MQIIKISRFDFHPLTLQNGIIQSLPSATELKAVAEQSKDTKYNQIDCDNVVEKLREYQNGDTGCE